MWRIRAVHNERGVALILALVVIVILAAIVLAVAPITTSELEIHRLDRWGDALRYVAIAGIEHQIYQLKASQGGLSIGYVNYPVLPGETAGCGAYWYNVSRTCLVPSNCSNSTSRQWSIRSDGEIWTIGCATILQQQRSIRATVTITYTKAGSTYTPRSVTFQRWEEVYP